MRVSVIGANGKIGRLIVDRLWAVDGLDPVAMVREEAQAAALRDRGVEAVTGDLEGEFAAALAGVDAVVFTAGSGAHTGKDKTLLVDLWGAVRVMRHCLARGPRRFVMVSAMRAGDPDAASGGIKPYLVAKWAADEWLLRSGLDFTVLRPGGLTDEPGTGRVEASSRIERRGTIPRADVAAAAVHCLRAPETAGKVYDLLLGDVPLEEALR
ncbi:MAG: SDR family oxidoreductase [Opitutales bacterium]|nr:SDR family oxidoreductase [Opitutales bacterium]